MINWEEQPYMDYVIAVDELLETMGEETSEQAHMDPMADGQEQGWSPLETAEWIRDERKMALV